MRDTGILASETKELGDKAIYLVTSLGDPEDPEARYRTRCVGWFQTKAEAFYAAENNLGDLYEAGWYPYLVIEMSRPGIYGTTCDYNECWWFRFVPYKEDPYNGKYYECARPETLEGVACFGMG